jgi:hypothetical protein
MAIRKGKYSRNREAKYITIRGMLGDPTFLSDDEVREIVIYTAGLREYQNKAQVEYMMKLSGNIDALRNLGTLLLDRNTYQKLLALREKRRYDKFTKTKADAIASFMNLAEPHNINVKRPSRFERKDGKPRAIERIGSSQGKIFVTYSGFNQVEKDFDDWFKSLARQGKMKAKNNFN